MKPRRAGNDTNNPGTQENSIHRQRVETVRELLNLFRMERMVYLAVTLVSVVVLLVCAVVLMFKKSDGATMPEIIGLFGSSGGITYSTGRLLKMWADAIRILAPHTASSSDE